MSTPSTRRSAPSSSSSSKQEDGEPVKKVVYVDDPPQPSRWFTIEYLIYAIVVVVGYFAVIQMMLRRGQEYNSGSKTNYGIVPGWFLDRKQDLSDFQYRVWRENFPLLSIGLAIFVLISNLVKSLYPNVVSKRILFYNLVSIGFLIFVHGACSIIVILIAVANFSISRILDKSKWTIAVTWIFNIIILWTSYLYSGYSFQSLYVLGDWGPILDNHYRGFLGWETYYKVSFLRFISYNCDYYWMRSKRPIPDLKGKSTYIVITEKHQPTEHYTFSHFFAYIFYIPLYIAGPICSFNAWIAQVYQPQKTYTLKYIVGQSIKILIVFLGLEIFLHFSYYYSFDSSDVWKSFSGEEVALTGYLVLNFMYVKFLIIWRVFRLFALYDGIDTPENMNRCVNNNYTFTGFWRSWHGSFNKWTMRYLYIPLGGNKTKHLSIWLIFFFIGLWHDLWWSWVAWALLNCVFFTIEIGIMFYFYHPARLPLRKKWYWRYIVALSGTANVFLLMVANLAILHGFENSILFIRLAFFNEGGLQAFLLSYIWLFAGIMFMMEIREQEKRSKETKPF
ncbi:membrane bound O-acyl transferase family protein [Cavenderia fasciculata]|uniref:Membrane bound O-acyl transferase family protein n=1 Tax=Cavenderia fasciculata TaxID=261658 RepID=F4PM06_CACFS|nr:membrane bound O-acyl transferase family protein [Cavenderia fasciculata]EGG22709.1 membrane bound O-acyl transferase family protein [Cavenderia fasciculata]|eukprot:XP_004360560.1 membrane bound O-acyl transferase family protein [Cavenderia fasciculata]